LDLRENQVEDLSPLSGLTELRHLMLDRNKITSLAVLVEMAKKDLEGPKRFAPFWNIYLEGNPLGEDAQQQLEELKSLGARIHLKE
jgi:Leucine-rich repeat (LRR) protein